MKKIYTFLLAIATSVTMLNAEIIEHVQIGYLNYNLDTESLTAEVTSIYYAYFDDLHSLDIDIPSYVTYEHITYTVTSIGDHAFSNNSNLASVNIPNSITSIGYNSFGECSSLTSITIPNSVKSIGCGAFSDCSSLTSVFIGNGVTNIENGAFARCSSLTSITIPSSVTSPGWQVFYGCSSLTSIIWNAKNCADMGWNYDNDPFYEIRSQITSFVIGNEVEHIPAYLCYGMKNLTSINIPNSVTSFGEYAFGYCEGLTSIEFPKNVTSIEEGAFANCSGLTYLVIPSNITTIGEAAFDNCSSLASVIISNGVKSIGTAAFRGCDLINIVIPESVTYIGVRAFVACKNLASIIVKSGNTTYNSRENCNAIIETATNTLICGCQNSIIPDGVTSIGEGAFGNCPNLTSITIPQSVTNFGSHSFYYTGLTELIIPSSVTSIGERAFFFCEKLKDLYDYATTPQDLDYSGVFGFTGTLHVPVESVDLYRQAEEWNEWNIVGMINTSEGEYNILYVDKESEELNRELVTLHVPDAPVITGFTFLKWQASGDLDDGIILQAVYTANEPTDAPEVANPANKAQKLIRNGNVYILTDTKTYNITGVQIK